MLGSVPAAVDLSGDFPKARSQGTQGSCVAWSVAFGYLSFLEHERRSWSYTEDHLFSPAFLYNQLNPGNCTGDAAGTTIEKAVRLAANQGVSSLRDMPYVETQCSARPSQQAVAAALEHKLETYSTVPLNLVEIKSHVARRTPVLVAMDVDDSLNDLRGAKADSVYLGPSQKSTGHAMVIVGYDDSKQAVRVLNSWGNDWGRNGFGWISYSAVLRNTRELYVAKLARSAPAPTPNVPVPPQQNVGPIRVSLTAPSTMKNILVGEVYYFGIAVGGTIDNATGRKYHLVVRFERDGKPITSKDTRYSDAHGYLAASTPTQQVPSASFALTGAPSIAIPQLSLKNSLDSASGETVNVDAYYDVYVDDFHLGRSAAAKITFRWN